MSPEPSPPNTPSTLSPGRLATRRDWGRGAHYRAALATAFTALLALLAAATALPAAALPGACPANEAIREAQHATFLPDCRAYEQVSPTDKSGGIGGVFPLGSLTFQFEQFHYPLQSSPTGDAVAYQGEAFYQPLLGKNSQYLSQRAPGSWSTQNLTPAVPSVAEGSGEIPYVGFSPDLSTRILLSEAKLAPDAPKGYLNLYRATASGLQPLLTSAPLDRSAANFGYAYRSKGSVFMVRRTLGFAGGNAGTGAVAPFTHLLFAANDALTTATAPAAVDGGPLQNNLYEWANGALHLVNVLPDGHTEPAASFGVDYGDAYNTEPLPSLSHVISADGSRVFWTDENSEGPNDGNLYVREDGERTALIATDANFQTASADGSRAFYTKAEHLYEYDTASAATTDLTETGEGGGVGGALGAGEDASSVYFVSTAVLVEGAQAGQPNLYLSHETSGQRLLTYVATLSPEDNHTSEIYGAGGTPEGDWYRTFAGRTAEVSPNGRFVAFLSKQSLTGYDNTGPCESDGAGGFANVPCSEAFLYDSATGKLTCASCNADGSRPTAHTRLPAPVNGLYQQRYLFDSGRLLFSTATAVLPRDTNGLSDVYEYQGGHDYLISPGTAEDEATFADASAGGNDVFFTTAQQLLPADRDRIVDLYDARSGGGVGEEAATSCLGEACRAAPPGPPPSQSPRSNGPLVPPPPAGCRKGFLRRHGACVRLHRHRRAHRRHPNHNAGAHR